MVDDDELLRVAADAFVRSHDFNGMTAAALAKTVGMTWNELRPRLEQLVAQGRVNLAFASHCINPHIKRLPDLPVEEQLRRLSTESPSGIGVYPAESVLRPLIDLQRFGDSPYSLRLALGAPQLVPVYFELKVLTTYFMDPRYHCRFWDRSGLISVTDEHYKSDGMPEKDKVLLESFGIGYDNDRRRVVVVFLRYLSDLSAQHQRLWQAYEVDGQCTMNSDYARASLNGEFPEFYSAYEAFIQEQIEINRLVELQGKPALFKATWEEDKRPIEFGPMLLPTRARLQAFAHTLDKMLGDNISRDFFKGDIELVDLVTSHDGSVERRPLGTLTLLERWLSAHYRTREGDDVSREIVAPWRKVRDMRQGPAHAVSDDEYSPRFAGEQDDLLAEVIRGLQKLRLALWSHPKARDHQPAEWLDGEKIVFY